MNYQDAVSAYLCRDFERLHFLMGQMAHGSVERKLIELRLQVLENKWEAADKTISSIDIESIKSPLLKADFYFTLGRFRYHKLDDSRESFLKAAEFYKKANSKEGVAKSFINSFLDVLNKKQQIELEQIEDSLEQNYPELKNNLSVKTYLARTRVLFLMLKAEYGLALQSISEWRQEIQLVTAQNREQFILLLQEIECLLMESRHDQARAKLAAINPKTDDDLIHTVNYLRWRLESAGRGFVEPSNWTPSLLLESFQERASIILNSCRNQILFMEPTEELESWLAGKAAAPEIQHLVDHKRFTENYQLQKLIKEHFKFRGVSQSKKIVDLLVAQKVITKKDLILALGFDKGDTENDHYKIENQLAVLIYRINKKLGQSLIIRQGENFILNNHFQASSSPLATNQTQKLIACLERGPIKKQRLSRSLFGKANFDKDQEEQALQNLRTLISRLNSKMNESILIEKGWVLILRHMPFLQRGTKRNST